MTKSCVAVSLIYDERSEEYPKVYEQLLFLEQQNAVISSLSYDYSRS